MLLVENAAELRALGSLIEKELTTPAYYPLTINALTAACNQKNNREPVVEYDEQTVIRAVEALREKALVSCVTGAGYRVQKYRHNFSQVYNLSLQEMVLLCLLILRGPQTPGELRGRSGSMHTFESLEFIDSTLQGLMSRETPMVKRLARATGQKEARYMHLLAGEPASNEADAVPPSSPESIRIAQMESDIAALRSDVAALQTQFAAFRKQFE